MIGPPGSGKSTQCSIISKKLNNITHVSTGNIIRENIASKTEDGKIFESFVSKGSFVPDIIMNKFILDLIQKSPTDTVILDGYARTLEQCLHLLSIKDIQIERVLILQCADDTCFERLQNRKDELRRDKDTDRQFSESRLKVYQSNFREVYELFRGKIQVVNGNEEMNIVAESIEKMMGEPVSKEFDISLLKREGRRNTTDKSEQCIICMTEKADHAVVPCGHQCGCENCLNQLMQKNLNCPICRSKIGSLVKVYRTGYVENDLNNENTGNAETDEHIQTQFEVQNNRQSSLAVNKLDSANPTKPTQPLLDSPANRISISCAPCETLDPTQSASTSSSPSPSFTNVGVTLQIPDTATRQPVDVCCVIDISKSMLDPATQQDPEDESKTVSDGLSIIDLVKHAVKTVTKTLAEQDRLAIVTFNMKAAVVYKSDYMNERNKKSAVKCLEDIKAFWQTNIWEGLETGMEQLRANGGSAKKFLLLLTDGRPNIHPSGGEDQALKAYFAKQPAFRCQVNTFGFGYDLDSKLLLQLAWTGKGVQSFIPDAKILGTNFVNCIANATTTMYLDAKLHLIPQGGSKFAGKLLGDIDYEEKHGGDEIIVSLGNLQQGNYRDVCIPMNLCEESRQLLVILEYENQDNNNSVEKITFSADSRTRTWDSLSAYARNLFVTQTQLSIAEYEDGKKIKAKKLLEELAKSIEVLDDEAENENPRLSGLLTDLIGLGDKGGRMVKALSTVERFNRWGAHYLRAICRAHQTQVCTNFMDAGLQVYKGGRFVEQQTLGGNIFLEMQMTQYDNEEDQGFDSTQTIRERPRQQINTVNQYAGEGGGCFGGNCRVCVRGSDGAIIYKVVSDVRKGDVVRVCQFDCNGNGNESGASEAWTSIECVVKIHLQNADIVQFQESGLSITKKHPMYLNGNWRLPIDLVDDKDVLLSQNMNCYVYNFVLKDSHVLLVNGTRCVTLGHCMKTEILWHDFYASNKVIEVLKNTQGYQNGFVSIEQNIKNQLNNF